MAVSGRSSEMGILIAPDESKMVNQPKSPGGGGVYLSGHIKNSKKFKKKKVLPVWQKSAHFQGNNNTIVEGLTASSKK